MKLRSHQPSMGTLATPPAGDVAAAKLYNMLLGRRRADRETAEAPPVLSLFASLLERAVQKNEKSEETRKIEGSASTVFHGQRPPDLSISNYLERIFKYSKCSPSCFVIAEIYMDRFLQQPGAFHLTSLNVHRLLMTSVVLAAKFIDDAFFNNAYYAKVGGISTAEMNRMEMSLLFSLDFRLHVTVPVFERHCRRLQNEAAAMAVERTSCKLAASFASTEELFQGQEAARRSFSCGAS